MDLSIQAVASCPCADGISGTGSPATVGVPAMKPAWLISTTLAALLLATAAWSASNLNLSKSNLYRLTYPTDLVSTEQAQQLLAALDSMGPADEAHLKQWLPANFKRFGIAGERVIKVIILPRSREMKQVGVILLTRTEDETAALATVKSSKSNSSD